MNNGRGSGFRGWVPSAISFDQEPHIIPEATVNWVEVGSTPLAEPFFDQTLTRLREATPAAREILTDIDTLFRVGEVLPRPQPAGFIFHISRCGSTLLANALKTSDQVVVGRILGAYPLGCYNFSGNLVTRSLGMVSGIIASPLMSEANI